ncbi:ERCC4 endonuclease [Halorubrum virus HRTV-11]|uniref:ERCC4 domain-containing protein EP364R n=1 Tax=Halorubrum sodomense tailed virus 2 TaxID=1262527 RepID=L7THM4_9CAUD|nr:ERCC4-type nuclease [Halorubrum sodomense tailed virus 2]AGC34341.1 hypothetical protein HSTV2_74 [Halorubrum sodomense tailed virus 2]UBF22223.1 ERCC4 endonuclease [Halorubrum virus HRTV-2]UBF22333.1 ERCC4 endonuclease [Halorubrum virus HRTV-11]
MPVLTILADNREQKGWSFEDYPVEVENVTLETGDYTIPEACDYDERLDTYIPEFAVERKSGQDFLQSITHGRERFKAEIKRAESWDDPLKVNVAEPWTTFQNRYSELLKFRKVYPNQIAGTVREWEKWYNVGFHFYPNRAAAEQDTFDTLMTWYRAHQYLP